MNGAGALYLVSTPIGNLGDLTYRAVEVLRDSDVILAEDTRRTRILLDRYGIEAGDVRSYHQHNEAARTEEASELLRSGRRVALVSDSGTPLISDPGHRLVRAAVEAGARIVPVPGPSAVLAALSASGLDPQPFTFLGFIPRTGRARREFVERLRDLDHTAVFFESPRRLAKTLAALGRELEGDRQIVVARELTKVHEEFVRGTLEEVAAYYERHEPRGEVVVCVGAGPAGSAAADIEEARNVARSMTRDGATAKEIVRALGELFGIERNRAYALALEVAEEK